MVLKAFCPRCGRVTRDFRLCEECYLAGLEPVRLPGQLVVEVCPRCGSLVSLGRGGEFDLEGGIIEVVRRELRVPENTSVEFNLRMLDDRVCLVEVRTETVVGERTLEGFASTRVKIKRTTCVRCSRLAGGYFEAVIQIRGVTRPPTAVEVEECMAFIEGAVGRSRDENAFITRVVELRGVGVDVYLGSNRVAKQVCRVLAARLKARHRESPKLVGRRKGKNIYRVTHSLRLPTG